MDKLTVAYFSMEVAVDPAIPTYNGGLGILAGDTLRAGVNPLPLWHRRRLHQLQPLSDTNSQVGSGADCHPSKVRQLPG